MASTQKHGASHDHSVERLRVHGLHRFRMHVRLPESPGQAGGVVPVRPGLHVRTGVHLRGLHARERAQAGEPVTTVGYGGAAWYVAHAVALGR